MQMEQTRSMDEIIPYDAIIPPKPIQHNAVYQTVFGAGGFMFNANALVKGGDLHIERELAKIPKAPYRTNDSRTDFYSNRPVLGQAMITVDNDFFADSGFPDEEDPVRILRAGEPTLVSIVGRTNIGRHVLVHPNPVVSEGQPSTVICPIPVRISNVTSYTPLVRE